MDTKQLEQLIDRIYTLHIDSITCDSCDEELDCLAELSAAGYDPHLLLPAVQKHLQECGFCREEFDALLTLVKAQQAGQW